MSTDIERQLKFIKSFVVPRIIEKNSDLAKLKLMDANVRVSEQLNGFMSNIFLVTLKFDTRFDSKERSQLSHEIIVKMMKADAASRDIIRAEGQFLNEIFIYKTCIPKFLEKYGSRLRSIDKDLWCARIYLAEAGKFADVSDVVETILAIENLSPKDYKVGGRSFLTKDELLFMAKAIGQYHAFTYALRIENDPLLEHLKKEINPLPFDRDDGKQSHYKVIYDVAVDRLFDYLDKTPSELDSEKFKTDIQLLKDRYGKDPIKLMDYLLRDDPIFSVILHGDYNRNNVLFRYDTVNGKQKPIDLRMIDFQELRYGTPAIDLSFYFYMNMEPSLFETDFFDQLYKCYHDNMYYALCELLNCDENDPRLIPYEFEKSYDHFSKFALYGAMVAVGFIPWMDCPEEECAEISKLWETDMFGKPLYNLQMVCGGEPVNRRITQVMRHASRQGFIEKAILG